MTEFIPSGYSVPKAPGNYLKLEEGANKFRVLSTPIMGYVFWTKDRKPVRSKEYPTALPSNMETDSKIKHFWALVIWNYKEKKVQIAEFTQATIQQALTDLARNEDWGTPTGYDITINAKDAGTKEVVYTVQPSPHKPIPPEAVDAFNETPVNLKALYTGADPFTPTEEEPEEVTAEENPTSDIPF